MAELYPGAVLRMVLWRTSDAWAGACRLKQAARSLTKDGLRRVEGREPERPMLAPATASSRSARMSPKQSTSSSKKGRPRRKTKGTMPIEIVVPLRAADETRRDARKSTDHLDGLKKERLEPQPQEPGRDINPYRDMSEVDGPMAKDTVHQTESKVDHPMGKSRHGVGQHKGN